MFRRILPLVACALLAVGMASPGLPSQATQETSRQSGDGVQGEFWDYHFQAADHEMYAWWAVGRLSQPRVYSAAYLSIKSKSSMIDAAGDHFCIQIAIDWRVPSGYNHHDARVLRNCDGNTLLTWNIDEEKLNDFCGTFSDPTKPCLSEMGRVQFARWYPGSHYTTDTVCRTMAGVAFQDCKTWDPWCNLDACRMKVRHQNGDVEYVGSLHPTDPNSKRRLT